MINIILYLQRFDYLNRTVILPVSLQIVYCIIEVDSIATLILEGCTIKKGLPVQSNKAITVE